MTIDECIKDYVTSARTTVSEEQLRDIVNYSLEGKPLYKLSKKYNCDRSSLYATKNYFANKYKIDFPLTAAQSKTEKTKTKKMGTLCKGTVKSEEDIETFIYNNQSIDGYILVGKIQFDLNTTHKKAQKLYRKYIDIFCAKSYEYKNSLPQGLLDFINKSKYTEEEILFIIDGYETGKVKKEMADKLGITYSSLKAVALRLKKLGYIKENA